MQKKLISIILALSVLASCLMAVPAFAAGDALTGITPGGQWGEREVMKGADFLNSSFMPDMKEENVVKYDKSATTAYQTGYSNTKLAEFSDLRLNKEDNGVLEINMDVTMPNTVAEIFPSGSSDGSAYSMRFTLIVGGETKGLSSTYSGLNVKYSTSTGAAKYGFPWNLNATEYVPGTIVPVKYVIEKKDGKISAANWVKIGDTWIEGTSPCAVSNLEGIINGVGIVYGHNGTRGAGSVMEWGYSNVSVVEKAVTTAQLSDLSKKFYPLGNEIVPVEFVLPEGYETAAMEVAGTTVATFDSASYPAGAYTANLNLAAISGTGALELTFGGSTTEGTFTKTTTLNRGIDEDYVPPIAIPAKVTFANGDGSELTAITTGQSVKAVGDASIADGLVVLALYQDKVLKGIKSGTGSATLTVPAGIDGTKASLKAFVLNTLDDANMLVRAGQWGNNDATLAELLISGKKLEGYTNDKDSYDVTLPASVLGWPEITPVANDSATSAVVTHTGKFPGTTTVALKAEDGTNKTITLNWSQEAAALLDYKTTTGKTLDTVVLEKPKFLTTPTKEIDTTSTAGNPERNVMYGPENITNITEICTDRDGSYWIAELPDELEGATMLKLPYDRSQWEHSTNVKENHKLISFNLNRSATVYVYVGNGVKDSTWIADNGWEENKAFTAPVILLPNTDPNKGYTVNMGRGWKSYCKRFEVDPWGEPVTVDIGCMAWSTNTVIVKFD